MRSLAKLSILILVTLSCKTKGTEITESFLKDRTDGATCETDISNHLRGGPRYLMQSTRATFEFEQNKDQVFYNSRDGFGTPFVQGTYFVTDRCTVEIKLKTGEMRIVRLSAKDKFFTLVDEAGIFDLLDDDGQTPIWALDFAKHFDGKIYKSKNGNLIKFRFKRFDTKGHVDSVAVFGEWETATTTGKIFGEWVYMAVRSNPNKSHITLIYNGTNNMEYLAKLYASEPGKKYWAGIFPGFGDPGLIGRSIEFTGLQ